MESKEARTLSRDCKAVQIPSGAKLTIPQGTRVRITQSLGGSYTVMTELGYLVSIAGEDADALGITPPSSVQAPAAFSEEVPLEKRIWVQLRTCFDPEIPVNIVDLGLIYSCKVLPIPEVPGEHRVEVKMTLTAPGCGMGEYLRSDIQNKLLGIPTVRQAHVELVWQPPWNPSMMTEAAKLQLGML